MKDLFLGYDAAHRKNIDLNDDDRAVHMHVLGGPGTGKSKLLEHMIREDIRRGAGLCLLDPHGKLYDDLVEWCIYLDIGSDQDWRELILLNPSKGDPVVGFNPFVSDGSELSAQVDRLTRAILKAWRQEDTTDTPTLTRVLRLIGSVIIDRQLPLPQVRHLINFNAREIRAHLIESLQHPVIQEEWRELQGLKKTREWRDEVLSTKNRLFPFLTSPIIARFMGIPDRTLDLAEVMEEGKILLVNLKRTKNFSQENQELFGTLLLSELFNVAQERKIPPGRSAPRPFYVYIDEFQKFLTPDIPDIIAEGRKMGIHLILSHQFLTQLRKRDPEIYDAVLTCDIKVIFGVPIREDALTMVDHCFVNQLDLKQIKNAIYRLIHVNKYVRENVYTETRALAEGRGTHRSLTSARGAAHGDIASDLLGSADVSGATYDAQGLLPAQLLSTQAHTSTAAAVRGTVDTDTYMDAETEGESEFVVESRGKAIADVPFILPIPEKELASLEYWTLEEQRWKMADALMTKLQRHAWLKRPQAKTQFMTVPFVRRYPAPPEQILEHEQHLSLKQNGLSSVEADRLLEDQEAALLKEVQASQSHSRATKEKSKAARQGRTARKAKSKQKKKSPLDDLVDDDPIGKE
ncbi:type IV secretion system DNA-binding domain-containing protein [Acidobacteria bacterium AH-259-D05]|nr:type IV secretion system DNA-binding domain-containing protein [Acidobacteria bacterium AH-259-D05]